MEKGAKPEQKPYLLNLSEDLYNRVLEAANGSTVSKTIRKLIKLGLMAESLMAQIPESGEDPDQRLERVIKYGLFLEEVRNDPNKSAFVDAKDEDGTTTRERLILF